MRPRTARAHPSGGAGCSSAHALQQLLARVERRVLDDSIEQPVKRSPELRAFAVAELDQVAAVDGEVLQAVRLRALLLEQLPQVSDGALVVDAPLASEVRL